MDIIFVPQGLLIKKAKNESRQGMFTESPGDSSDDVYVVVPGKQRIRVKRRNLQLYGQTGR